MVKSTIIITEDDNRYQVTLETLESLSVQATGWNKIFLKTLLRKFKIFRRDGKTFTLFRREKQTLENITAQIAAKGGES